MSGYGSIARVYDGEYGGIDADIAHHLHRLAARRVRGAVLELGCGTGRVAVRLAREGYRVTGLDSSRQMLRRAWRARRLLPPEVALRLRYATQDMTSFRFRHRFGAVVAAFSTFNLLATAEQRRACLERVGAHLEPGGVLLLDMVPRGPAGRSLPRRAVTSYRVPGSDRWVDKTVDELPDDVSGVVHVRYAYSVRRWLDDAEVDSLSATFDLAPLGCGEVETLLEDAGFLVDHSWGSYRGDPYRPDSRRLLVEATYRPAP